MDVTHSARELHEIENELHIEILPGTEVMADIGDHHFVKSGDKNHRVLVPQPSADKNDPLNWSLKWKILTITSACVVTFSQGFGPLALAPMFEDYIEAFDTSLANAVQFTGVAILVLGFSNFVWVPISTSFGRRPVYLASQLINVGACIWRARATTYTSFLGACALNGVGAGPAETIQPAVIADIFFLHDRGKWNTLYWVVYMGSLMVGPIISGPMAQTVGWRNFWWLNVALLAFSFLLVLFGFPETKWDRADYGDEKRTTPSTASPPATEKLEPADDQQPGEKRVPPVHEELSPEAENIEAVTPATAEHTDPWLGRGSPKRSQWALFQANAHPWKSIFLDLWIPWKMMIFPIVQFASFVVSWSCSSFLTINLTQTQAFAPRGFTSLQIGFMNFAILIGAFIGLFTAGPLSDWVAARLTKRNGGIREPEMRLPAMIPYVIIMYLGNIITSVGFQEKWPWAATVVIGWTCAGIQVAALPSMASTYAVDSYKPVTGSLFVSITVNKNVWGYGFSKFITPWAESSGFIPPIMTNASLILLWCLFGILFYYKGKTFRRWSKDSSVHRL